MLVGLDGKIITKVFYLNKVNIKGAEACGL